MSRLIYGVGVNDHSAAISWNVFEDGVTKKRICKMYSTWRSMLKRCYCGIFKNAHPTYRDCVVCEEWKRFSVFRQWMITQDWVGKELDKDILGGEAKIYSPETCCFISPDINKFLTDSFAARGDSPLGVTKRGCDKFCARCDNPFTKKTEHLGIFHTKEHAHLAWATTKLQHALGLAIPDTKIQAAVILKYQKLYENAERSVNTLRTFSCGDFV